MPVMVICSFDSYKVFEEMRFIDRGSELIALCNENSLELPNLIKYS